MLIALEGIDGSGKETQAKLLNRWVKAKGHDTFLTKEPTSEPIGRLLREFLKRGDIEPRTEALLFAADRSEHTKVVLEKLEAGKVVITERYFYSSVVYQGASGISVDWIMELNRFVSLPDLVLVLDIPPEISLERITSKGSLRGQLRDMEHFERKDFLSKVRDLYLDLAKKHENFAVVDASLSVDEVQTSIRRKVGMLLSEAKAGEEPPDQRELREYF
ncbi:MAG: dTMP kinase [Candidatus Hydrothermarchaeaceae archaeon]